MAVDTPLAKALSYLDDDALFEGGWVLLLGSCSFIIILLLIYACYEAYKSYHIYNRLTSHNVLPRQRFVPLFGRVFKYVYDQHVGRWLYYWIEDAKHHGAVNVQNMLHMVTLRLADPRYLSALLKNRSYEKPLIYRILFGSVIGEQNLLLEDDHLHSQHRRMFLPAFKHASVVDLCPLMSQEAHQHISSWLSDKRKHDQLVISNSDAERTSFSMDLHRRLSALTLEILSTCAFGAGFRNYPEGSRVAFDMSENGLRAQQWRISRVIAFLPFLNRLPILRKSTVDKAAYDVRNMVEHVIQERCAGHNKSVRSGKMDLLDVLMQSKDEQGHKLNHEQLRDQALMMLAGGHETSAGVLTWTVSFLLLHQPSVWQQIVEEVDAVCHGEEIITWNHLLQMHVIDAVLHESMRFFPPVPVIMREAKVDHVLEGDNDAPDIFVPKGTTLIINIAALHRSPRWWGDNASQFDHTRWLHHKDSNGVPSFRQGSIGVESVHSDPMKNSTDTKDHADKRVSSKQQSSPLIVDDAKNAWEHTDTSRGEGRFDNYQDSPLAFSGVAEVSSSLPSLTSPSICTDLDSVLFPASYDSSAEKIRCKSKMLHFMADQSIAHPYAFLPFSSGVRGCMGRQFALIEMKIIMAALAQKLSLTMSHQQKLVQGMPVAIMGATLRPDHGVFVHLHPRL